MPTNEGQENPWTSISFPSRVATSQLKRATSDGKLIRVEGFSYPEVMSACSITIPATTDQCHHHVSMSYWKKSTDKWFSSNLILFVKEHVEVYKFSKEAAPRNTLKRKSRTLVQRLDFDCYWGEPTRHSGQLESSNNATRLDWRPLGLASLRYLVDGSSHGTGIWQRNRSASQNLAST